jgi:hypothetical protein
VERPRLREDIDVDAAFEDVELVTGDLHRAVAPLAQQKLAPGIAWHDHACWLGLRAGR